MFDPVLLAVYALAIARVVALVTGQDSITEHLNGWAVDWLDNRPRTLGRFLAEMITCPWCAGVWVSLAAAPLVWFWGDHPLLLVPALAFAFAQVVGMISGIGR